MAVVTISAAANVLLLDGPLPPFATEYSSSTSTTLVKHAVVFVNHQAQTVGAGDNFTMGLSAFIQNAARNGKVVNCRKAVVAYPAFNLTQNSALAAKSDTLTAGTTGTFTFIPTTNDWSTNAAIASTDKLERGFGILVTYTEQ